MSILDKPFYQIAEICARWNMGEHDIAAFVLAGELTLSTTVAGLRVIQGTIEEVDPNQWAKFPVGHRSIIGTVDIERDDAWMVLREGCHVVHRFKAAQGEYVAIDDYRWSDGLAVYRGDLVICKAEVDRFEATHPGSVAKIGTGGGHRTVRGDDGCDDPYCPPRPGAPTRYDWDGFWVEVCRRIYEDGVPHTQGELIRLMLDWFTNTGRRIPDTSTLKKKVSPLWRQIAPRGADEVAQVAQRHRA